MKMWGMEKFAVMIWLWGWLFSLSLVVNGCAPKTNTAATPQPTSEVRQALPQPTWEGEPAKIAVMEFDNRIRLAAKKERKRAIPDVFGKRMKQYLVKGLLQTEQFSVLDDAGTARALKANDFTAVGQIKRKTMEKLGPFEGTDFLISGAVITYQPSKESLRAGIEADPFFAEFAVAGDNSPTDVRAKKLFEAWPAAYRDRIVIGLSLIDVTTGKTFDSTIIEGTAQEFGLQRGKLFEEKLLQTSGSFQTPMQKALRACTIKAVSWIAETGVAYRRQAALRPASPVSPAVERPSVSKKSPTEKKSEKSQTPESQPTNKPSRTERSVGEKPAAEKPRAEQAVAEEPPAEKPTSERTAPKQAVPKQEAPQTEEWGQ
jgi:curli biogenesis system outer membrane secretion channel CsgG